MDLAKEIGVGWVAGAGGVGATHPIDTMRVRIQHLSGAAGVRIYRYPYQKVRECTNIISICRGIINNGGVSSFFRGIVPPVVTRGGSFAIQRGVMSLVDPMFSPKVQQQPILKAFLSGMVGASASSFAECPVYVLKARAQVSNQVVNESLQGYATMARDIIREVGVRGLYLGFPQHAALCIPSWAVLYATHKWMVLEGFQPGIAGAAAAVICWPIFYPFDVIRTQIQTTACLQSGVKADFWKTVKKHFAQHPKKWCPGLSITLIRAVPRFYITFMLLDLLNL